MNKAFKSFLFWILAFVITIGSAIYQRVTGPNYPVSGNVIIEGSKVKYKLKRTHAGESDHPVTIKVKNDSVTGQIEYKRFKTNDEWTAIKMIRNDDLLTGFLPAQPAAGKLEYKVTLKYKGQIIPLAENTRVVIRYRGDVPSLVLIPHILLMFLAMMYSTRAGIAAIDKKENPRGYVLWTTALLFLGGMILGPLVQKYAFNAYWTGFPFGHDLTDNKTLMAFIAWIIALIRGSKNKPARVWVLAASIILLAIYLIPHSMFGSELDYSQME